MSRPHPRILKPVLFALTLAAAAMMVGCVNLATLTGEPAYVGHDPSGRSVYQAPLWEGGGYFVYDYGARTFLKDR